MSKKKQTPKKRKTNKPAIAIAESEDEMGKWATYQRRGGSSMFGSLAAPGPSGGDWTIGTVTATTIPTTRVAPVPSGAVSMLFRAINNVTGAVTQPFNTSIAGLTTATAYRVQAAWFNGTQQVSEASPATLVTTA
jgi:hypothetical protein